MWRDGFVSICGLEFYIEFIFTKGTPTHALSEYPDPDEVEIKHVECLTVSELDIDTFYDKFEQDFINQAFELVK